MKKIISKNGLAWWVDNLQSKLVGYSPRMPHVQVNDLLNTSLKPPGSQIFQIVHHSFQISYYHSWGTLSPNDNLLMFSFFCCFLVYFLQILQFCFLCFCFHSLSYHPPFDNSTDQCCVKLLVWVSRVQNRGGKNFCLATVQASCSRVTQSPNDW